jgi:cell wall assembly regulator SMI1
LGDTLNYGILPQDLANIEMQFGFSLPQVIRESYLAVDGQEPESSAGCSDGLFFGLHLLPLDEVLDEWRFWREVDDDPNTGAHPRLREVMQSVPPNWIRKEYSQRGWIPLISDKTGNYVGVDLNPEKGGSVGQVIVFGRDFDTKVVLWRGDGPAGWAHWLASFAEDLESREGFELGLSNESEGSEDDVGYESYFFDGIGQGSGEASGGTTTGGMRLVGEYRGWTTLEAWADKSVRKWQEVGLVSDPPVEEKGKAAEKVGLGVLALASTTASSGAEVPIPVFADVTNSAPSQPKRQGPDDSLEPPSKAPVPAISITKPPAPLPVDVPTHDDITLVPDSEDPHPDDLESGGPLMEASHLSKSEQGDDGSIEIPLTQRTANMSPKDADPSPSIARAPVDPLPEVAYLLDDSVAPMAASPMKHSSPTGPSPQDVPPPLVGSSPSSMDDESDSEHSDSASTSDEDDYVLARTASTSRSDMEVAESIG